MPENVIRGQRVAEGKVLAAREMRTTMTLAEKILWSRLRANQLGVHFRRQQVIDGFIADFYCHEAQLVVEADGAVHDAKYDEDRDAVLAQRGILVQRFSNDQIEQRIGFVLHEIKAVLNKRLTLDTTSL